MLCDDCHKNEASIHITQISAEGRLEKNLCSECAVRYGDFMPRPETKDVTVNDFLKVILGKVSSEAAAVGAPNLICPNCGMTYQDFVKAGKIGCGVCYATFRKYLTPLLTRIHGASVHSGKIPRRSGGELALRHELGLLKDKLKAAVHNEEYEKAAQYRDKIRAWEKKAFESGKEERHGSQ